MSEQFVPADLQIRPATSDDIPPARSILVEAAEWLNSFGIDHWPLEWSSAEETYLRERLRGGELYLACLGDEPIATLVLQWADPRVWGAQEPNAGYVHRLAVRRAYAGRGVGRTLLAWAAAQVVRSGRCLLRLDCMADNQRLCQYYEELGFSDCGKLESGTWSARLYEQTAARLLPAPTHEAQHGAPA